MSFREEMRGRLSATLRWPVARDFPHGIYLARDLKRFSREFEVRNIFDVGAHHGQSAIEYAILFPHARIDSFEPVRESFVELQQRTSRNSRIHCHNFALGSRSEDSKMDTSARHSALFKISSDGNEQVTIKTAVDFCHELHIDRINFMKVDTEGFDLEVLRGAKSLIESGAIDLIQVEAGMNPENEDHIYFEHFTAYLQDYGYRIFGIYEQGPERLTHPAKLRRANIVFASPSLI